MISEKFLLKCYAETGNRKFLQRAKAIAKSERYAKDKRFREIETTNRDVFPSLAECQR
jgi:hypothetical protein